MDEITEWLAQMSQEAASRFPAHSHVFIVLEDGDGDVRGRERSMVSSITTDDLKLIGEDLATEAGSNKQILGSHRSN